MALVASQNPSAAVAEVKGGGDGGSSVSLGKGAWDCDANVPIPADKEGEVFEEMATMDMPYEGIPTVPMRKDMDHMAFFCSGCRYRVTAHNTWSVEEVKKALFKGGIARSNKPEHVRNTPGIQKWSDLELIYAGQRMKDGRTLKDYHVPPGCQCLIAIERAKLELGKPEVDSAYWN
mmetsp:Transcript_34984/g.99155  ORF Transcript_34984/g.99155 Transcript_34984/m.99155 type:complete len:176 (+) Transcript_34984:89-616(+)|eukprot:CAMPEP_0117684900 /NCGR_PEP_ID=MMETSP0804-20121206/21404_1 /TAXON_ID=1074897 /ORGANISM="Tetraselmis astigmatica, Strain CCMP880" /LENGTH=175 /DNA_ID=CAMNT_0005496039 /DNA_START=66 /DNA_END=593 /DNA_ORIENTATION=+